MIGASGIGKTTLTDLLTGLVQPTAGRVRVDGVPLAELDLGAWRRQVGYVPQDLPMLHDSVRRNVTLGDPSLDDAAVEAALRLAGAWEFVRALPGGLDASVGERGALVSGGQRQRISIARALVHEPRLLIFDEATAALDAESEAAVWQTIASLRGRTTVVAISHHPGLGERRRSRLPDRGRPRGARRRRPRSRAEPSLDARSSPTPRSCSRAAAVTDDPLARSRGASHRALLARRGRADARARAHRAARRAPRRADLDLDRRARGARVGARARARSATCSLHRSKESPARSVADALGSLGEERVLVTTADHALLSGARVDRFLEGAAATNADVAVGVVERAAFADAAASAARTWIRLRCGSYTGANLFAFQHARAKNAAAFFARAERHRKKPWRMVAALGPTLAIEYLAGTLDLESACKQVSRSAGATIRPVLLDDAVAAIDVDKAADLALAEKILAGES